MSGSLAKGTAILGIQQAVAFLGMMTLHVATGRYFGPEIYGLFSVVHAVLSLLVFTFLTGLPHAVTRFTAENREAARSVLRLGVLFQSAIGIALALGLYVGAGAAARLLDNASLLPLFQWGALALPMTGIALLYAHGMNGLHWFGRQALVLGAMSVLKVVAVLSFLAIGAGPAGAVRGLVFAAGGAAILALFLGRGIRGTEPFPAGRLVRYATQLGATYLAVAIWEQVDLLILESVGSVAADPGLFAAVSAVTAAPESIFFPLILTLFPAISRSSAAGETGEIARYLSRSLGWAFRLLCPLVAGSFFLGNDLLGLFYGTEYLAAAFAIGPLMVAILFYTLYQLMDTYLRASGHGGLSWRIAGGLLIVHIALDLILVPRFQLVGTVATMVASSVLAAAIVAVPVCRRLGIRANPLSIAKVLAAAAVAFIPLALWDPGDGKESVLLSVPLLAVYGALLYAFREINREDLSRIRQLVAKVRGRT